MRAADPLQFLSAVNPDGCGHALRHDPFKVALPPLIHKAQEQDHQEDQTYYKAVPTQPTEEKGPGEEEHQFYLKNYKNQGNNVKPGIKLIEQVPFGFLTTLVGGIFLGLIHLRTNQTTDEEIQGDEDGT